MKYVTAILISLLFFFTGFGQDSLKKHQFIISTYPSNLFVGDASIGFEHCYKKRWSQETMIFAKCFGPNYSNYKYDRGYRFTYLLKYNFVNRKRFRVSANLSFTSKHIYFNDKPDAWLRYFSHSADERATVKPFLMDKYIKAYGPGLGFTFNYKLSKHFSAGNDLQFEYLNMQRFYNVNNPEKLYEYYPEYLYLPAEYAPKASYRTPYHYRSSVFYTIKLSYYL